MTNGNNLMIMNFIMFFTSRLLPAHDYKLDSASVHRSAPGRPLVYRADRLNKLTALVEM